MSIAWRTFKTSQYGSSQKIDFFFHMGANPFSLGPGSQPEMLDFPSYRMFDGKKSTMTHVYTLSAVSQLYTIGILQIVCAGSISLVRLS